MLQGVCQCFRRVSSVTLSALLVDHVVKLLQPVSIGQAKTLLTRHFKALKARCQQEQVICLLCREKHKAAKQTKALCSDGKAHP